MNGLIDARWIKIVVMMALMLILSCIGFASPAERVQAPEITFLAGEGDLVMVTLTASEPDSVIYYSLSPEGDFEQHYQGAFECHGRIYVKAIAMASGRPASQFVEGRFNSAYTATPTFDIASHSFIGETRVSIRSPEFVLDPQLFYRLNGGEWLPYAGRLTLTETAVIESYALENGLLPSPVSSITVTKQVLTETPQPMIRIAKGQIPGSRVVTIEAAQPGTELFYTLNGELPTLDSEYAYEKPLIITEDAQIVAIAFRTGQLESIPVRQDFVFNRTEAPWVTPFGGVFQTGQSIEVVMSAPEGSQIHYTLDGSIPNESSAVYQGPITIDDYTILKAFAVMPGFDESQLMEAHYSYPVRIVATPEAGMVGEPVLVSLWQNHPLLKLYYAFGDVQEGEQSYIPYVAPFLVQPGTLVKAVAVFGDYVFGENIEATASFDYSVVKTKAPVITPESGIYEGIQRVTLISETPGAEVYYGIGQDQAPEIEEDGRITGILYTGPFEVTAPCEVYAVAVAAGLPPSDFSKAIYRLPNRAPVASFGEDVTTTLTSGTKKLVGLPQGTVYDPDGDELTYTFFLNGSKANFEQCFTDDGQGGGGLLLPIGEYTLKVIVSDGSLQAEASVTIHVLDGQAPRLTYTIAQEPNFLGWHRSPVMVHFTAWDEQNELLDVTEWVTLSTEGKDQTVTGSAEDRSGNRTTLTTEPISIDTTPPVLSDVLSKPWIVGQPVLVDALMDDALSGMAMVVTDCQGIRYTSGDSLIFETSGTQVIELTGEDKAGNSHRETVTVLVVEPSTALTVPMSLSTQNPFRSQAVVRVELFFDPEIDLSHFDASTVRLNNTVGLMTQSPGKAPTVMTLSNGQQRLTLWFDLKQVKGALLSSGGAVTVTGNHGFGSFTATYQDGNAQLIPMIQAIRSKLQGCRLPLGQRLLINVQLEAMAYIAENHPGGREYLVLKPLLDQLSRVMNGKVTQQQLNRWRQEVNGLLR